jgi:hypothetical protein
MTQTPRRLWLALCLLALIAGPASAASDRPGATDRKDPVDVARDELSRMVKTLDRFLKSIPRYEPPRVNEHGDIIIPRKRNEGPPRLPSPGKKPNPHQRFDI